MIVRRVGRALAGLALIAGVSACDDNPLAEDRDQASYFRLNPSTVTVNAGSEVKVDAQVVNQYGAATNAAVTGTACDNRITAVPDTGRSVFEYPERFVITGTNNLGQSCLIVRGGGITDTIMVMVAPAAISATGLDTLDSGLTGSLTITGLNAAGGAATGLTNASVRYVSLNPTIVSVVDTLTGELAGRAPGTAQIVVTTRPQTGATRVDTATVVVRAGPFTGTVSAGTTGVAGASLPLLTVTEGAIAFDDDTQLRISVDGAPVATFPMGPTTGPTRQVLVPFGVPAGQVRFEIVNMGPDQVAVVGTTNLPNITATDLREPDGGVYNQDGPATTIAGAVKTMAAGDTYYGSVSAADANDWIRLDIAEAGTYTITLDWTDESDIDLRVRNAANSANVLTRLTLAHPETGSVALEPGSYWVVVELYEHVPSGDRAATYKLTAVKQ